MATYNTVKRKSLNIIPATPFDFHFMLQWLHKVTRCSSQKRLCDLYYTFLVLKRDHMHWTEPSHISHLAAIKDWVFLTSESASWVLV
jgi:hypothetical protein